MSRLQCIASRVQQQALSGEDRELTSAQLTAVERIFRGLANVGPESSPPVPKCILWSQAPQDVAAYLALFSSALHRSSPFGWGMGIDPKSAYANIRKCLCKQLHMIQDEAYGWRCERLGAALLRTDTLQCYSRLLAAASEQLQPAASALFSKQPDSHAQALSPDSRPLTAAAEHHGGGLGGERPGPKELLREPNRQQPNVQQLGSLLFELVHILEFLCTPRFSTPGADPASAATTAAAAGSSSGNADQPCPPNSHVVPPLRTQVQSSWVLEHCARVLLLATAPALANNHNREQQADVQAVQSLVLKRLCRLHNSMQLQWSDFLRRPCGCTLAATHMAHLCAALDGAHAFGLPRPAAFVLQPLDGQDAAAFVMGANDDAVNCDAGMYDRERLVNLLPVLHTLRAWTTLLGEALQEASGSVAAAEQQEEEGPPSGCTETGWPAGDTTHIGGAAVEQLAAEPQLGTGHGRVEVGGSAPGAPGCEGLSEGPGADGGEAAGQPGPSGIGGKAAAGMEAAEEDPGAEQLAGVGQLSSLPPFNRAATFTVCLRLARIVLARWDAGCNRTSGAATADPLLPKVGGCVALQYALACARLVLLPDVWGRERVPRRTRAPLRAWWEAYVAAAQHPEALLVAVPERLDYSDWKRGHTGGSNWGMGWTACCRVRRCSCGDTVRQVLAKGEAVAK